MALTTYTELKAAVATWLSRTDETTNIVDFITLCEAKLQRQLRAIDMETRVVSQFGITAEYVAVPADFLQVRSMSIQGSPRHALLYMPDETMDNTYTATGRPKFFNVTNGYFRFAPAPDGTYDSVIVYYAKIPVLSGSNATNWVLTKHPDVYLYGSLLEACAQIQMPQDQVMLWKAAYDAAIFDIQKANNKSRWSGQGMEVRLA